MVVTPNAASARVDHTYLKRGVYYFNRRVPLDVSRHYKSRRINFSLRTKSVRGRCAYDYATRSDSGEGGWPLPRLFLAAIAGDIKQGGLSIPLSTHQVGKPLFLD
ncbi:MAG: DUF6538 domain-containing protein, partial [Pseudomonadota bacterium]|nr:DUF6538 domain-containing protein [Pseudomonadota bacterium]